MRKLALRNTGEVMIREFLALRYCCFLPQIRVARNKLQGTLTCNSKTTCTSHKFSIGPTSARWQLSRWKGTQEVDDWMNPVDPSAQASGSERHGKGSGVREALEPHISDFIKGKHHHVERVRDAGSGETVAPSHNQMPSAVLKPLMPKVQDIMATHAELDVSRHTKYFLRTLKTFLPTAYQSNDSNRMSLAFFTLSGLDLLGSLETNTTEQQRKDYIDWIYSNQHEKGGFRAFPGTDFGDQKTKDNECWDPANLPATFFALCSLLILNDDLSRVNRKEALQWLTQLQRPDGSFGETLVNGTINGGTDSRFGYCATGVRYVLRGTVEGEIEGTPADIEVDNFVTCIRSAEVC